MTLAIIPAKGEPVVDQTQLATLYWQIFFEGLASGDAGTPWNPVFTGLSATGTPTITGIYYQISSKLSYFRITITPAGGGDTTSVAGTTYCDNFPLTMLGNSANVTLSGFTAVVGGTTAADKKIYPASWSAIASPITIIGIAETN